MNSEEREQQLVELSRMMEEADRLKTKAKMHEDNRIALHLQSVKAVDDRDECYKKLRSLNARIDQRFAEIRGFSKPKAMQSATESEAQP